MLREKNGMVFKGGTFPYVTSGFPWFADEARKKFGDDQIKTYQTTFNPMYHVMTERKTKCLMKLVCLLPNEKVCAVRKNKRRGFSIF